MMSVGWILYELHFRLHNHRAKADGKLLVFAESKNDLRLWSLRKETQEICLPICSNVSIYFALDFIMLRLMYFNE